MIYAGHPSTTKIKIHEILTVKKIQFMQESAFLKNIFCNNYIVYNYAFMVNVRNFKNL